MLTRRVSHKRAHVRLQRPTRHKPKHYPLHIYTSTQVLILFLFLCIFYTYHLIVKVSHFTNVMSCVTFCYFFFFQKSIANHSDRNMMGVQNLCTLFGPTLMKLSPKEGTSGLDDMNKEIRESMQQAQVLFYLLQLHAEDKLIPDVGVDVHDPRPSAAIISQLATSATPLPSMPEYSPATAPPQQLPQRNQQQPQQQHQQQQQSQAQSQQATTIKRNSTNSTSTSQSEWQTTAAAAAAVAVAKSNMQTTL